MDDFFAVRATYTNGNTELETIKDTLEEAQEYGRERLAEEPDEGQCGVVEICIDTPTIEPDSNEWWQNCHMKHSTRTVKREW